MFLHTGLQNFVKLEEIEAMNSSVYSAPTRRLIKSAEADGRLIDHTEGRKTRSVIFLRSGAIVLSCVEASTLVKRGNAIVNGEMYESYEEDVTAEEPEAAKPEPEPEPEQPKETKANKAKGGKGKAKGKGKKAEEETVPAEPADNGNIVDDLP